MVGFRCFAGGNPTSSPISQAVYLRVRRALDPNSMQQDLPCQLRYTGEPELGTGTVITVAPLSLLCSGGPTFTVQILQCSVGGRSVIFIRSE